MIYDMQDHLETLQWNLQHSLVSLQVWCKRNGMLLNTDKTKLMLSTTRQKRVRLDENLFTLTYMYNDIILQLTTGDKILGMNAEQNLLWNNHFQCVSRKVSSYEGHFRSNITVPVTSLCMIQFSERYRILYDYIFLTKWLSLKEKTRVELEDTRLYVW